MKALDLLEAASQARITPAQVVQNGWSSLPNQASNARDCFGMPFEREEFEAAKNQCKPIYYDEDDLELKSDAFGRRFPVCSCSPAGSDMFAVD